MSRLTKKGGMTKVGQAVQELNAIMGARGAEFANKELTQSCLSMESLDDATFVEFKHHSDELKATLKEVFQRASMEGISDAALDAGVIAAMAAGDPIAYAERFMNPSRVSTEGVNVVDATMSGAGGNLDYAAPRHASLESFDERELRNGVAFSVGFNIGGSRQTPLAEAFFPTYTVSPDQAFIDVAVKKPVVMNEFRHAVSGKAADFGYKNLAEAYIDANILADVSIRNIPVVLADNSNKDFFAPAALYTPVAVKQSGVDVLTAPLRMNKTIDIIGISTVPGLVGNGIMDNSDALDSSITLDAIYLSAPNAAGDDTDYIRFDTSRLPRRAFSKTVEGQYREMGLQFRTESLLITPETVNTDKTAPAVLKAVKDNDWTVRVKVNVDGTANVQYGNINVYASQLEVMSIVNAAGQEVSLASGPAKALVDLLALAKFTDYDVVSSRTNSNRRTSGLQADVQEFVDRHPITLGSPLSAPAPITAPRDGTDLQVLNSMSNVRNTNQAITTLFNYAETLKAFVAAAAKGVMPEVEGAGRYLLHKPFYEEIDLKLDEEVNSLTSSDRAEDVSALIVNTIREVAYRMYVETGYQAALDIISGGAAQAPTLLIGTDPNLVRHIWVNGDPRTAGIAFQHQIVSDLDNRLKDTIFLTFTRQEAVAGPDPLSFGTHAWTPPLASVVNVNKNGANIRQAMVQPRNRHINHLPVLVKINVSGLTKALTAKSAIANHVV